MIEAKLGNADIYKARADVKEALTLLLDIEYH